MDRAERDGQSREAGAERFLRVARSGIGLMGRPDESPTLVDARSGLISAELALAAEDGLEPQQSNVCLIWHGAAKRGLGWYAYQDQVATADRGTSIGFIGEDFSFPGSCANALGPNATADWALYE